MAPRPTLTYMLDSAVVAWTLPIDALALIAEYTTNEGPQVDDYFLVFVTVEDGVALSASCSFYAEGRDSVLSEISRRLGSPIELRLAASTGWTSRVVWPPSMEGLEYFDFMKVPPKNVLGKLKQLVLGSELDYRVSDTVRDYISAAVKI